MFKTSFLSVVWIYIFYKYTAINLRILKVIDKAVNTELIYQLDIVVYRS